MTGSSTPGLESRIRGAIFGALVGDALGVPVEFTSRAQRDADPVHEMLGGGTWGQPAGTWSDDGALLLCTTEATIDGLSVSRLGAAYVQWMRQGHWSARGDVFDIGNATAMSLERLADGIPIEEAGATGEDQNGNGALMRVLPIGLRFWRSADDEMCSHAAACSRITHAHRRSQLACGFYCLTIASVLRGDLRPPAVPMRLIQPNQNLSFNQPNNVQFRHSSE